MVTIKEIAEQARVSVATVSYALNGKSGIREKKRDQILKIAKEMGYVPNSIARSLQSKSTNVIGVVMPRLSNSFNSELLVRLEECARLNGYYLLLGSTDNKPETEAEIIEKLIYKNIDALLIVPGNYANEDFYLSVTKRLEKMKIPVIFLGAYYEKIKANYIALDIETAMFSLTKQILTKTKCERLLFFGGHPKEYYTRIRIQGITKACEELGQTFPKKNQINIGSAYTFRNGHNAIKKYLEKNLPLTGAIMAVNDLVAYGIIKGLKEKGINVPADLLVTGCDDIFIPTLEEVRLTTIRIPIREMAQLAIDSVLKNISNPGLLLHQQATLQLDIINRETA